jgi:hypothetical protein
LPVVEKPVLGRGLDSLIAGGAGQTGRRASDLLSPFQAKRTRVAPGLRALLQGARHPSPATAPKPGASPPAPVTAPQKTPTTTALVQTTSAMGRLRIQRPPFRPTAAPPPRYRLHRPARGSGVTPEQKKNQGSAATGAVHSSAEPAFQKPVVRRRPVFLKSQPAPKPPPQSVISPGFRLGLFIVDWFLLFVGFAVVWYSDPPVGNVTLILCCLAVILGATLGSWSLMLEPHPEDEDPGAG